MEAEDEGEWIFTGEDGEARGPYTLAELRRLLSKCVLAPKVCLTQSHAPKCRHSALQSSLAQHEQVKTWGIQLATPIYPVQQLKSVVCWRAGASCKPQTWCTTRRPACPCK